MMTYFVVLLTATGQFLFQKQSSVNTSLITEKSENKTQARIVGGTNAPQGHYPYQISLRYKGKHICGGSIVHNQWIVTAAHCVLGVPTSSLEVVAGSHRLSSGGIVYNVTEISIHENFNSTYLIHDVAMLKIKPITYTESIAPVILDSDHLEEGEPCILSGWGMKIYPGSTPDQLQHINLTTIKIEKCQKLLHPIEATQICTLTRAEEGACRYDSGGPLVRKVNGTTKQIGVVSWGILCGLGFPDVYSRVSSYIEWFRQICKKCV